MTRGALRVCRDPRRDDWQLGSLPPAQGHLVLVGWRGADNDAGGGVPADIAQVLARGFTAVARVTFACSSAEIDVTSDWTAWRDRDAYRGVETGGAMTRLRSTLRGAPRLLTLCSTRDAATAARLFDDGGFPWWLQGQVVVLSRQDGPPPDLTATLWHALLEDEWLDALMDVDDRNVFGIVRPGVDGAVAGIFTSVPDVERAVIDALRHEAEAAGVEWAEVAEDDVVPG